jgi:putative Holliday junction resolvase
MTARGAVLALDVGTVRIGVAVSESRVIPTPLEALTRVGRKRDLDAIEALVARYRADTIVVGLPLMEDGRAEEQAEISRAFARSLARRIPDVRIHLRDERYTTAEAREILGRGEVPKGRIDSIAAAVILREFLAAEEEGKIPPA